MQHATGGPEEQMFQTWALEGISKIDMINDKSDLILSSCCFNVLDSIYPRHCKDRTNTYQNNSSGQLFATIINNLFCWESGIKHLLCLWSFYCFNAIYMTWTNNSLGWSWHWMGRWPSAHLPMSIAPSMHDLFRHLNTDSMSLSSHPHYDHYKW